MKQTHKMKIKKVLPGVKENVILAKKTTFKIGGPARYFFVARNKEDLIKAIKAAKQSKTLFFILGEGSNILAPDKGYDGLIIKIQNVKSKIHPVVRPGDLSDDGAKSTKIYIEAFAPLSLAVLKMAESSLTGLEWAAGIPGTVGGAVRGNAGAFGKSIKDIVKEVEVFNSKTEKIKIFKNENCRFDYRNSIFKKKNNLIILSVILKLKKGNKKKIQEKMKEFLDYRKKNHPFAFFSAGCIFQNYQGRISNKKLLEKFPKLKKFNRQKLIPASYLIEKCGLKGKRLGKAEISKEQANFILNLGGAKAKDVMKLIKATKQKVKNKFGIILKEEIEIIHNNVC